MNEQQLTEILWQFVGWSLTTIVAIVGVLVGLIYRNLVASIKHVRESVGQCATKQELEEMEDDIKAQQSARDQVFDQKLDGIRGDVTATRTGVTDMHRRMDDLYKFLVAGKQG